jgi:geranylgeranyl transferase type-2 subunit alpha
MLTRGTVSWINSIQRPKVTLTIDDCAVHAWNYRRYVLASLPGPPANSATPARTPASELAYTREKIEANFSNFSAWHQRSKVFESTRELEDPKALDEGVFV